MPPLLLNRLVVTRYPLALSDTIHPHTHRQAPLLPVKLTLHLPPGKSLKSFRRTVRAAEMHEAAKRCKHQQASPGPDPDRAWGLSQRLR